MSARTNVVIVAGAGAGKTYALVDEYLRTLLGLLEDDGAGEDGARTPDRILAVTFTDKAAHEMRARVLSRLSRLRFHPEEDPLAPRVSLAPRAIDALSRAVATAPIVTFHALCARLLRDHAWAADVDPRFSILEPIEERRLVLESAEAAVIDAVRSGDARVAELVARVGLRGFGDRPALVECLVQILSAIAERGVGPDVLPLADGDRTDPRLAIVDTRAALAPLRAHERGMGALLMLDGVEAAWLAARGGRDGADEGDDPEPRQARAFVALRAAVAGNWGGAKLADARRAAVVAVDRLGSALVDAHQLGLASTVQALCIEVERRVRAEKDARGVLGFGDLLVRARELLRDHPAVRARAALRFDRVLVDEYQDTSPVQEDVLALLAVAGGSLAPGARGTPIIELVTPKPGRVLVVGDPRQSIYAFRGADPHVLARALTNFAGEGGERRDLVESRRSVAPVVALANAVAEHALPLGADGVPAAQLVPMTSLRGGEGAAGAHWIVGAGAESLPAHEREAIVVARQLADMFQRGVAAPKDVAVLVRRQKAAGPIARALGRAGILADVVGGDGFWLRPEVSDLVCALAVAVDPHDELSVLATLRSPFLCAPDDAILALYEHLPDEKRLLTWPRALLAAADQATDRGLHERMMAFDALLEAVRAHVFAGRSARAVDALLDEGGYAAAMAVEVDGPVRARNAEKLRALVDARGDQALVGIARLSELLDERPTEAVASARLDGGDDRDAVRVMTIHQAKGLEFPVVVLADAGSGLKGESDDVSYDPEVGLAVTARGRPIAACVGRASARTAPTAMQRVRRRMRDRAESELARVLYVALTRARDRVFVVGLPRRVGPGSLAGILERVRVAAPAVVDALLPKQVVDAEAPPPLIVAERAIDERPALEIHAPRAVRAGPLRVRASELSEARAPQPTLFGPGIESIDGTEDAPEERDRLPPRATGRLAHALIALATTEIDALTQDENPGLDVLRASVADAARALGVRPTELSPTLVDAVVRTLRGPIRALRLRGAHLSFEERLRLERGGVVVEGRADLVARLADRAIVVEMKNSVARAARAELQAMAYAAALADLEATPIFYARWAVGEDAPAAEAPFKRAAAARLDAALAEIRARDSSR